jgi:arylsulfatase
MVFSADETADVGIDLATPVVESIGAEANSRFTGRVNRLTVEVGPLPTMAPPKQAEVEPTQRTLAMRKAMAD